MDKIIMKNLSFFGYHGVLKEENVLGQKFFVDIELYADLKKAGLSDDVQDTVHYGEVYNKVKEIVENRRFKLLEALGENIADTILNDFSKVNEVCIKIRKPGAPVNGIFDYFGIEIRRNRNE
ncbi:dihydroneopterin aldolase [Paramaledivibacter caminithermalis]|jgi:dihydroneopterin aldolase|uniref:7,8-dihydroneopterin aldolase n=1 Tax=Paramaledivibacter caminithermalis (strain DSM 15212 / CIP 107654 / DViRD3) TaxID=1121301 RepID=A0A1M6NPS6_PARC5|nr:dihydroneopterin aldolase [Paramaledivibacter caminithermalis]SHJ97705.1 dihydroneopterin aldolase [Paramaledivibacter caminithermalis DSM 15212]